MRVSEEVTHPLPRATWLAPSLLALAPVVLVGEADDATIAPAHVWGAGLVALAVVAPVQLLVARVFGADRAALWLTAAVLGLVVAPGGHPLVAVAVAALWAGALWKVGWELLRVLAVFHTAFAAFLVGPPAVRHAVALVGEAWVHAPEPLPASPSSEGPDIWWIVLDGYSRHDVLADRYGIHESLADHLERRGFFVGRRSRANYAQTTLAMAAAWNLEPLHALLPLAPDSQERQPLRRLVRRSRMGETLRAAGWTTVAYGSEYAAVQPVADHHRRPFPHFTEYEHGMLFFTALPGLTRLLTGEAGWWSHRIRRNHLSWTFDELGSFRPSEGPLLTLAHITAPHPPFVFEADGAPRPIAARFAMSDGSDWHNLHERGQGSYVEGYTALLKWLDRRVLEAVDRILASDRPSIIVIHADHGGGREIDWNDLSRTDVVERMTILNAVYFPDRDYRDLHHEITPIDSARAVLSRAVGVDLPLRDERSYLSVWDRPFELQDVTERLRDAYPAGAPVEVEPSSGDGAR